MYVFIYAFIYTCICLCIYLFTYLFIIYLLVFFGTSLHVFLITAGEYCAGNGEHIGDKREENEACHQRHSRRGRRQDLGHEQQEDDQSQQDRYRHHDLLTRISWQVERPAARPARHFGLVAKRLNTHFWGPIYKKTLRFIVRLS